MTCGIYRCTNTITGDCYIGSSKQIEWRKRQHVDALNSDQYRRQNGKRTHWQNAWNLYGPDAFVWEIFDVQPETISRKLLEHLEDICLKIFWPTGYNINPFARRPSHRSGYKQGPRSKEHGEKIAAANRGRVLGPQTEDHIRKRVEATKKTLDTREEIWTEEKRIAQGEPNRRIIYTCECGHSFNRSSLYTRIRKNGQTSCYLCNRPFPIDLITLFSRG